MTLTALELAQTLTDAPFTNVNTTLPGAVLTAARSPEALAADPFHNYGCGVILNPPREAIDRTGNQTWIRLEDGSWANVHEPNGVNLHGYGVRWTESGRDALKRDAWLLSNRADSVEWEGEWSDHYVAPADEQPEPAAEPARLIVSLFDYSGTWSGPYADAGYHVFRVDLGSKPGLNRDPDTGAWVYGGSILEPGWKTALRIVMAQIGVTKVHGLLAAPPCRVFCKPGAKHWKRFDADGGTEEGKAMVRAALCAVAELEPVWWALENPPGRLANKSGTGVMQAELGKPALNFQPWHYAGHAAAGAAAENYTKQTYLWGVFAAPERSEIPAEPYPAHLAPGKRDRTSRLSGGVGGKDRGKRLRAQTPTGFASAFFTANP